MGTVSKTDERKRSASGEGFSAQERAAMRARAAELKADARRARSADKAEADESDMLAKIADMPEPDRGIAERLHAIVMAAAPDLAAKLYYGQPGWAKGGKIVCFFRSGQVDKERYSTFGFSQEAKLDDSGVWPTSFAVTNLSKAAEKEISALVKKAVG